jgi:hypothetical protein
MFATLINLELVLLTDLSREEMIAGLLQSGNALSLEFTEDVLEAQSTDVLRLFVLATKLARALGVKQAHERQHQRQ